MRARDTRAPVKDLFYDFDSVDDPRALYEMSRALVPYTSNWRAKSLNDAEILSIEDWARSVNQMVWAWDGTWLSSLDPIPAPELSASRTSLAE